MIGTMVQYAGRAAVGDHYLDPRLDGWVRDGPLWTAAHQVLAGEVFAAVHPGKLSDRELLAQQLTWRRLQERTSRLRLEGVRSRVEPLPGGGFRAVLDAELFNPWTLPVDAELKMGPLPAGWRAVRGDWKLADMPPGGRAAAQLVAEGPTPPAGWDAKMKVPLSLTGKVGGPEEIPAAVPFLAVPPARGVKLTIDGDLGDWPLRRGHAAAGFALLGRRGRVGDGQARLKTVVFALHDAENLYLAFRCEEDKDYRPRARAGNVVRYDQLLAAGEDMVEVIVDPGRTGKAAEDLYHLVVKSNAVSLAERGVAADPPLGRSYPWPVRLSAAVGAAPGLWTVELAIPLKDFGPGAAKRTWGVNFTRFSTAERAASSWAGAIRYFYDPKNLGTMYMAE
jgi:hypothetical protein